MAINLELIEATNMGRQPGNARMGDVLEHPLVKITNITAAGATALQATTAVGKLRNRAGGDSVYVHLQLASSSVQAAADKSYLLAAGEEVTFALPKGALGTSYEVDVRATA